MVINALKKNLGWIAALLLMLSALILFQNAYHSNSNQKFTAFQHQFFKLEKGLTSFLDEKVDEFYRHGKSSHFIDHTKKGYFFHAYEKDTLISWNSNHLPILRFADIHFPSEGIVHLQNGWYYSVKKKVESNTFCATMLIKNDYAYQNKDLQNTFSPILNQGIQATIVLDEQNGFPIYDKQKTYLFSLVKDEVQQPSKGLGYLIFLLPLLAFLSLVLWLNAAYSKANNKWYLFGYLGLVALRIASIKFQWITLPNGIEGFEASLYGTNEWFPNFFEFLLNLIFILGAVLLLRSTRIASKPSKVLKLLSILSTVGLFAVWPLLLILIKGLVENSSIPLVLDELFSLNFYSIVALVGIGILGLSYYLLALAFFSLAKRQQLNGSVMAVLIFVLGVVFFIYEINWGFQILMAGIFPLLFMADVLVRTYSRKKLSNLRIFLVPLLFFALATATNLGEFNMRKERSERELYANKLSTEKDITTELEYDKVVEQIKEDNILKKIVIAQSGEQIDVDDFTDGLERRIFNNFWERYEMNFYLFDSAGNSLVKLQVDPTQVHQELEHMISEHSSASEINPNIYFIKDYFGQFSYIFKQRIQVDSLHEAQLYGTFKSKKIPEEIGFPRLLISSGATIFEHLEKYSIAKYHDNKLITKYGEFNYPSSASALLKNDHKKSGSFNFEGFNHYTQNKSGQDMIILSARNYTWINLLTTFSYLFSFYGLLLIPGLLNRQKISQSKRSLSLSLKIQLVLIVMVFLALLGFGWGSGIFVRNQYNSYTNVLLSEKLSSIEKELRGKIGSLDKLTISDNGAYISYQLQKLSKVFVTDINLYDSKGHLVSTSRPKVFNMGLIGEQINPIALQAIVIDQKSEFLHQESIGLLNYTSGYLPYMNNEGKQLGFINLQHFGQQEEFENQIQRFLMAIINVFMLLLAITIVIAVFVSSWVTKPLRMLHESFASVRFGKENQAISYPKNDEIGVLVHDYNQKLEELEYTAHQLAQSERETAWREMAKQVAHEIKNPLTPMKLSVQQLQRSFDPNDPKNEEKIRKVSASLIEQIDALTNIANEFSNFAKMPKPNVIALDLVVLIENVMEVFQQEEKVSIHFKGLSNATVQGDKDQLLRVLNNLIKNATQSVPENAEGHVSIVVSREDSFFKVEISDNGVGIAEEQRKYIFEPYFTTKSTGSGLGLAMVKQIIVNHGGTIGFDSEPNVGTTFYFTLPAK